MNYTKKLCILKQVASGFAADGREVSALLTAEQLGGRVTLTLAPIGFAPLSAGRYRCVVQDAAGGREAFDLPPEGAVRRCAGLDISRGLGCAVCFVHGRAQAVAFGRVGEGKYDPKAMCLPEGNAPAAARQGAPHRGNGQAAKNERPQAEQAERAGGRQAGPTARAGGQTASTNAAPTAEGTAPAAGRGAAGGQEGAPPYDDEKIAPENYFAFADAGENDRTGEEDGRACGRADAAPAASGGGGGEQAARRAQGAADSEATDEARGESGGRWRAGGERSESGADEGQTLFKESGAGEPCYYDRVRGELEALFARHPAERELADCIPYSRWAKVSFARGKYYAVGVISDEQKPRYICYGVPAAARTAPPDALRGFCSFMPLSVFEPEGRGYWMMFQDADTGQCVRIERK